MSKSRREFQAAAAFEELTLSGKVDQLRMQTPDAWPNSFRPARGDWAPDPHRPLPRFDPPRRVPHSVTLVGRLFDEGTLGRVGLALEHALGVADERPPGFA